MFKVRWEIWHESCCKFSVESSSKKNLKSSNISQSYERISSATFLWLTVYIRHYTTTNFTHNLSNQNLTATDAANAWSCNYVGYMCCCLVSDNKVWKNIVKTKISSCFDFIASCIYRCRKAVEILETNGSHERLLYLYPLFHTKRKSWTSPFALHRLPRSKRSNAKFQTQCSVSDR